MNAESVVKGLKNGKVGSLAKVMIFHNMQEIVPDQLWMKVTGYLHYEELLRAGISEKHYEELLQRDRVSAICYLVDEQEELNTVFKQMEALKEIYSPVPIRIAIWSKDCNMKAIPTRFRWVKGIEVAHFSKEDRDDVLDWLIRTESVYLESPTLRLDTGFYLKNSAYASFLQSMKWERRPFGENLYFGGFFRALLVSKELYHSVMSGYDFVEFMLSMVHYYYKAKCGEGIEEGRRVLEYKEHAVEILRLSKDTPRGRKLQQEKIHINTDLSLLNDKIKKYYGITVVGEAYNFLGIVDVLQKIRNRTRGHGVIVGKTGMALWDILFTDILILAHFLEIGDFLIEVQEDKVYAAYKEQESICLCPFVIGQNDVPCILHQTKGKQKREYINYFYGEYAIPDFE